LLKILHFTGGIVHRKKFVLFLYVLCSGIFILLNASPALSGSVTLSWNAPSTNEDGTPLNGLGGYKVYYGTRSRTYTATLDIGNLTTYRINNLTDDVTYYIAVTAYDGSGNESEYSNEVSKKTTATITTATTTQGYTLTVNKSGTAGTVSSSSPGITCGSDCSETYTTGKIVTLTASPNSGSVFTGWSGGGCAGNGQCVLTMNTAVTVTATFSTSSVLYDPANSTLDRETIIDNHGPETSQTGIWSVSSGKGQYGTDSVWSRDGSTFTWNFTPSQCGDYQLSMWWTTWSSRSAKVPVDIQYSGGTARVYINQQLNGGKWNSLGTYSFEAGKTYKVTITARPGPSSTCADAVKFDLR
jgi:hypothetical protein